LEPAIIVHGGAWGIPDDVVGAHLLGVSAGADAGYDILRRGGTSLDAVEAAVTVLEDDTTFDAGRGAFLNRIGEVELDAMIMDGKGLRSGAVAAVRNIRNPVKLARAVMDRSRLVLLAGEGASMFARAVGIPGCRTQDLLVGRELARWKAIKRKKKFQVREIFETIQADQERGTVGAAAIDRTGSLAAATSTGGVPHKPPGRVGDSPIIGAGAYADNESGAVSATGWGEPILRVVLSKAACDLMGDRLGPAAACRRALAVMKRRVDGIGGLIGVDRQGRIGFSYTTPRMARALVRQSGRKVVGV
jgi:beta-aspartyl-peptidase (threonine type)